MASVPDFDPTTPSIARVYDYLLDGKDNFAVDREAAERLKAVAPLTVEVTRENRQFLARAVTWAANQGITQFIDLGCGMPTVPNTHGTARAIVRGRAGGVPGQRRGGAQPSACAGRQGKPQRDRGGR